MSFTCAFIRFLVLEFDYMQLFLPQFFLFLDGYRASWQTNTEKLNEQGLKAKLKYDQWFAIIRNGQKRLHAIIKMLFICS